MFSKFVTQYDFKVNILVEDVTGSFIVFEQTKYGLEGLSLAVVGGMIEPSDANVHAAAKRELNEEMGLTTDDLVFLGRYRTDVNRGGGYVNCFLARHCQPAPRLLKSDDLEPQKQVHLTRDALVDALMAYRFKEVKWSNTIAMALQYLAARHSQPVRA
jgi:8-oxo-dGTP pyrophosphatase MutT (NUDIX family)